MFKIYSKNYGDAVHILPVGDRIEHNSLWHVTSYRAGSPLYSLAYNQESTHDYDTGSRTYGGAKFMANLTGPNISSAELRFWHWYQIEYYPWGAYDRLTVELSTDGEATWQTLRQWDSRTPSPPTWLFEAIPLPPSAIGNDISIRFYFDSGDSVANGYEGWYIDDMEFIIGRL